MIYFKASKPFVILLSLVLTLDVSSNFIMPAMTKYISLSREILIFTFFLYTHQKVKFRLSSIGIMVILLIFVMLFYGPMYGFYFVRLIVYFLVCRHLVRSRVNLAPFALLPIGLLLGYFFFTDTYISQGARFFIGNATVVGAFSLALYVILRPGLFKYLMPLFALLTGSLATILSFFILHAKSVKFVFALIILIVLLPLAVPEGETARRLSAIGNILKGNVEALSNVITLSARFAQMELALNNVSFSHVYGMPFNVFIGKAGIESQIFHFYAYGGILGSAVISIFLFILVAFSKRLPRFDLVVIICLFFATLRPFESAALVFAFSLMLNYNELRMSISINKC